MALRRDRETLQELLPQCSECGSPRPALRVYALYNGCDAQANQSQLCVPCAMAAGAIYCPECDAVYVAGDPRNAPQMATKTACPHCKN